MSRNLASVGCAICGNDPQLTGPEHPITIAEAGRYFSQYASMLFVANAECLVCRAKYLAWVRVAPGSRMDSGHWARRREDERPFVDLSFRSSFNDEPGSDDLPEPEVLARIHEQDQLREAARLRAEAAELVQKAIEFEDRAATGKSNWETYRSLGGGK